MSGSRSIVLKLSTSGAEKVRADLEALGPAGEAALKRLDAAARASGGGVADATKRTGELNNSLKNLSYQVSDFAVQVGSGGSALTAFLQQGNQVLGGFGVAGAALAAASASVGVFGTAIVRAGDQYQTVQAQLRNATGSAAAATEVFESIYQGSLRTGIAIDQTAGAFARFAVAARQIGATNADVLALTNTIQRAGVVAGSSASETAAATIQLGQALASGRLQGDELRSILENLPTLAEALARQLGVGIGELRKMGEEGKLTADTVFPALLRAGEDINRQFEQMPVNLSRGFGILNNAASTFLGKLDDAIGLSRRLGEALAAAGQRIDAARQRVGLLSRNEAADAAIADAERRVATANERARQAEATAGGEQSLTAGRRGGISTGLANAARAANGNSEADDIRREQAEANEALRTARQTRLTILREADNRQVEEYQRGAQARQEAARSDFRNLQRDLDDRIKVRETFDTRRRTIERAQREGAIDQAAATTALRDAEQDRDQALQRIQKAEDNASGATRARSAALRDQARAQREAAAEARRAEADQLRADTNYYDALRRDSRSGLLSASTLDDRALAAAQAARANQNAIGGIFDPQERDKAEKIAERFNEKQARDAERTYDRITDYAGNALADLFLDTEGGWEKTMASLRRTAIATFAKIAAEALLRPIIQPVSQVLTGGGGVAGAAAAVAGGGATPTSTGTASPLGNAVNPQSIAGAGKSVFSYDTGQFNTGFGGIDSTLNSTAYSGVGGSSVGYGAAALGGVGVIGGAYGAYTGFKDGSPRGIAQGISGVAGVAAGATTLAGGSAAVGAATAGLGAAGAAIGALAAAAPYIAAIAAIVALLLPGQKPSNREGNSTVQLATDAISVDGQTGAKYSQENRDQARGVVQAINDYANKLGAQLGGVNLDGSVKVGFGDRDGLYAEINQNRDERKYFKGDDEEAKAKELLDFVSNKLLDIAKQQATGDYGSIARNSANIEELTQNLEFFETTYKNLGKTGEAASSFVQGIEALNKPFDDAKAKALSLGLSVSDLADRQAEAVAKAYAARDRTVGDIGATLEARRRAATGEGDLSYQLRVFDRGGEQQLADLTAQLKDLGFSAAETGGTFAEVAQLERTLAAERLKVITDFNAAAVEAEERRVTGVRGINATLDDRAFAAGNDNNTLTGALAAFDRTGAKEVADLVKQLSDLGYVAGEAGGRFGEVVRLEQVQADERLAIIKQFGEQAAEAERQAGQQRVADEQSRQGIRGSIFESQGRGYLASLAGIADRSAADYLELQRLGFSAGESDALFNNQTRNVLRDLTDDALRDVIDHFGTLDGRVVAMAQSFLDAGTSADALRAANENLALRQQAQEGVAGVFGSIADYVRNLQIGSDSGLSPEARLAEAQRRFDAVSGAAAAGDYASAQQVTQFADLYRQAAADAFASPGRAEADRRILTALENVSSVNVDTLTASAQADLVRQQTDSVVASQNRTTDAVGELKREIVSLRLQMAGLRAA